MRNSHYQQQEYPNTAYVRQPTENITSHAMPGPVHPPQHHGGGQNYQTQGVYQNQAPYQRPENYQAHDKYSMQGGTTYGSAYGYGGNYQANTMNNQQPEAYRGYRDRQTGGQGFPQQDYNGYSGDREAFVSNDEELIDSAAAVAVPTTRVFPSTNSVMVKSGLEYGICYDFGHTDKPLPLVQPSTSTPIVRCKGCRAYINCYCRFIEDGARWRCSICKEINEVPNEYYSPAVGTGVRQDRRYRAELTHTAFEYVATNDYVHRPPIIPICVLAVSVSEQSVKSGFLQSICNTFTRIVSDDGLPGGDRAMFSIITYDLDVHFYSWNKNNQTQIGVISNSLSDLFLPVQDALWNAKDQKADILRVLSQLPSFWCDNKCTENNLSRAIGAINLMLGENGGKAIVCQVGGINDSAITEVDKQIKTQDDPIDGMKSTSKFCNSTIAAIAHRCISYDMVLAPYKFNHMYLGSLGDFAHSTNGRLFYYPNWSAQLYQDQMIEDISQHLKSIYGWEVSLRARISNGWVAKGFYGNYQLRTAGLLNIKCLSSSNSLILSLQSAETVAIDPDLVIQMAALYTTCDGLRRIRVITTKLATSDNIRDIAGGIDVLCSSHLLTLKAVHIALAAKLADGRAMIHNKMLAMATALLQVFPPDPPAADAGTPLDRNNLVQMTAFALSSILKSYLFQESRDITADQRYAQWSTLRTLPLDNCTLFYFPVLYEVSYLSGRVGDLEDTNHCIMPWSYRLTFRSLNPQGTYIVCNGFEIVMWIGKIAKQDWIESIFGTKDTETIHAYALNFVTPNNPLATKLFNIVNELRSLCKANLTVFICRQGDGYEPKFLSLLTEDKTHNHSAGFMDLWSKFVQNLSSAHANMQASIPPHPIYRNQVNQMPGAFNTSGPNLMSSGNYNTVAHQY